MSITRSPWAVALIIWPIWVAIVLGGQLLQSAGSTISLADIVSSQISLALVAAPLFLLAVVAWLGWWQQVGFRSTAHLSSLRLLWLPALFLAVIFLLVAAKGLPSAQTLGFIAVNTLLVGFSEELMFRGVLLHGARSRFSVVAAVAITAVMFGSVHVLNGLLTGDFPAAFAQALQATLFGVWIAALRLRLGSIWPVIVVHGLWDLGVFLLTTGTATADASAQALTLSAYLTPALLELPLFLYGLYLLRGLWHQPAESAS